MAPPIAIAPIGDPMAAPMAAGAGAPARICDMGTCDGAEGAEAAGGAAMSPRLSAPHWLTMAQGSGAAGAAWGVA